MGDREIKKGMTCRKADFRAAGDGPRAKPEVLSSLRFSRTLTCSHRLRGLPPSSSGSPSLLHLRALAPQRHIVSSWQGTVEPQPPPHARSMVAWPIARQGSYGGQPARYPGSRLSRGRSHSPHPIVTSSYDEPPNS